MFLKRHWPDLVIISLIGALLAGFLAVLIGGVPGARQNLPLGAGSEPGHAAPPATATTTAPANEPAPGAAAADLSIPAAPRAGSASIPTIPARSRSAAPIVRPQSPADGRSAEGSGTSGADAAAPSAAAAEVQDTAAQTGTVSSDSGSASSDSGSADSVSSDPIPSGTVSAPVSSARTVPTSRDGTPTRSEFRISAGVYGDPETARNRTAPIAALGYTVHVIPVPQGAVAQIGPFSDQATAERAAEQIRAVFGSVTISPPLGQTLQPAGATQAPAVNATAQAPQTETRTAPSRSSAAQSDAVAAPATTSAAAGSGASASTSAGADAERGAPATPAPQGNAAVAVTAAPVYLQVGSFSRAEYATPLVEKLTAQGFQPTVNAPAGGNVRVLVGPFGPAELASAEARLRSNGHDYFKVR